MKAGKNYEVEIKLRVENLRDLIGKLAELKAKRVRTAFEHNMLFDTAENRMRRSGRLLRLRLEWIVGCGGKPLRPKAEPARGILTYKGATGTGTMKKRVSRYKVVEENEVEIPNPGKLPLILNGLGLRPTFRYEKRRTLYRLPGLRNLQVELDETPEGVFVELEGPRREIDRAARMLGYGRGDYLTTNYWSIYRDACRRKGKRPGNMVFSALQNQK
jgi:adenylate cyclase class 2